MNKVAGSRVYAGTINQTDSLESKIERIGRTRRMEGIEVIQQAGRSRVPVQRGQAATAIRALTLGGLTSIETKGKLRTRAA